MPVEWIVPLDHPAFAGHFPGRPIVPGVVLLDQVLLLAEQTHGAALWTIAQAKFLRTVGPGECLQLMLSRTPRGAWGFEIQGESGLVATGVLQAGS